MQLSFKQILLQPGQALLLKDIDWSRTSLLISSYGSQNIIFQDALEKYNVPKSKIITLYDNIKIY